ncbi:hypothetical protein F8M41_016000 [Gigaspora margarita]|uniref:BZIP domain-containing protein n=1 Tax=Gigaspora margarita TaxID=4874 RepID=A0A8H4EUI8_GIGMA|nr:hypothetical protein F8M41_016000 [Gigaspora margarita]
MIFYNDFNDLHLGAPNADEKKKLMTKARNDRYKAKKKAMYKALEDENQKLRSVLEEIKKENDDLKKIVAYFKGLADNFNNQASQLFFQLQNL